LVLEATDANSEDIAGQLEKVQDHAVKLEAALERANKYGAQADKDLERFLGIIAERKRQDDTWGVQDHPAPIWLAILTEEVGEVAKIILCMHCQEELPEELKDELTQVAAVAVAWLEKLEEADANAKTNS
jgi:NTP pyrophosphatase (non-canonical NTP hydrolase)